MNIYHYPRGGQNLYYSFSAERVRPFTQKKAKSNRGIAPIKTIISERMKNMSYKTGRNYCELQDRLNKLNEDYECRNMSSRARAKQKAEAYKRAFWEHMAVGAVSNSLKEGSDGSGGYLVPDTFEKELITGIQEKNFLRKLGTTIKTNRTMKIPRVTSSDSAQWISENTPYSDAGITYEQLELDAHKLGTSIIMSEELIDDCAIDLERYLKNEIIYRFSVSEEEAFLVGDGNGKPTGIIYQAPVGVITSETSKVSLDDILDLIHSVRTPYREKTDTCFVMSDTAYLELKKTKLLDGRYIWNSTCQKDGYDTLFGYRVYVTSYLDGIEENSIPILYGDFRKFIIGERKRPVIKRLGEIRAKYGQIEYVASERIDAKLFDKEAVKSLKVKSK